MDDIEQRLTEIWADLLFMDHIGPHDNFMDLGGDSLLAAQVAERIRKEWITPNGPVTVPLIDFYADPTVAGLSKVIRRIQAGGKGERPCMVEMQSGPGDPFFCMPGGVGRIWGLRDLAEYFQGQMPFCGFNAKEPHEVDVHTHSIDGIAAAYIAEMKQRQPEGPYQVGGLCYGSAIALEVAQQLRASGDEVRLLVIDPIPFDEGEYSRAFWEDVRGRLRKPGEFYQIFRDVERRFRARYGLIRYPKNSPMRDKAERARTYGSPEAAELRQKVLKKYKPAPYAGSITVFLASENRLGANVARRRVWQALAQGEYREVIVPGEHDTWTKAPHVKRLAHALLSTLTGK